MKPVGRPRGEVRTLLAAAVAAQPGTCRELSARTLVGVATARETLNNMVRAGELAKNFARVPGVCRPVPVYYVAASRLPSGPDPLQAVMGAWLRQPMAPGAGPSQESGAAAP